MKAIIFYITATLTMVLLSTEISLTWLVLAILDTMLILWCKDNISIRELTKLTGYDIWKRTLN